MDQYPEVRLVILGDFNLTNVSWITDEASCSLTPLCQGNRTAEHILDNLGLIGLQQYNNHGNNRSANVLDLCFSNSNLQVIKCDSSLMPCDDFHPPLLVPIDLDYPVLDNQPFYKLDFTRAPYHLINNCILSFDWYNVIKNGDINLALSVFYDFIYYMFEVFVPLIKCYNPSYPSWFTRKLQLLIRDKKLAHKKFMKSGMSFDYNVFSQLRAECKSLTAKCYSDFIKKSEANIIDDPKTFWKFVNAKRKDNNLPNSMQLGNVTVANDSDISNCFADEFQKAFTFFKGNNNWTFTTDLEVDMSSFNLSASDVFNHLANLDNSACTGIDQIPPVFLRSCAETLFLPIYLLFQKSLETCTFPEAWKTSKIVPIHKNGSRHLFENYRPISVISIIPKLFEALLVPQLSFAFKQVIDDNQHGFLSGKSVETNLYMYTDYLYSSIANASDVHAIYTDFSKAFDKVNHDLLIYKMGQYGVSPPILEWFTSYLSTRSAQVSIRGSLSRCFSVSSGVPQGSHFGPLLFLIFINDIGIRLESQYLLFADDLKVFRAIRAKQDVDALQADLGKLEQWCSENDMLLNSQKCKCICFSKKSCPMLPEYSLGGTLLDVVQTIRDLGVVFDTRMSFVCHYDAIISKASKMWGFIQRSCRHFTNVRAIKCLYLGLVRSHLDYCCMVWSPFYKVHINRIENVQRQFLRCIKHKLFLQHSLSAVNVAAYLGIMPLYLRRWHLTLVFFFKVVNCYFNCSLLTALIDFHAPAYGTRSSRLVSMGPCKTLYILHCPQNAMARLVNDHHLALPMFGVSLDCFKRSSCSILLSFEGAGLPY